MDLVVRGVIEQYIDFALSDQQMMGYRRYIEGIKPFAKSIDDAILGLVIGLITASCLDQLIFYNRCNPVPEDMIDLQRIIIDKIPKIKSRISETFT